MKRVIDGKRYDTDTAKMLAERYSDRIESEMDLVHETLYRTKSGNYFLHAEGGANTKYCKWRGENQTRGEHIIPLSLEGSQKWAEEYLDAEEYEKIFGAIQEDTVKISADLLESDKERFDALKKDMGKTSGELITWLVDQVE